MLQRLVICSTLIVLASSGFAQQRNQAGVASLVLNQQASSIVPIEVSLPRGSTVPITMDGTPDQPLGIFFSTVGIRPTGGFILPALGPQLIDLDDSQPIRDLFEGFDRSLLRTDASGFWGVNVALSSTTPIGARLPVQGFVANPAAPWPIPVSLTAASDATVVEGVTVVPLNLANNGNFRASFASFGLPDFPFYEQSHATVFINTDGNLTFGAADGDFTPTPTEFHNGRPRIAAFWTDLDPNFGGNMQVTFDPNGTFGPEMLVEWDRVAVFQNTGGLHTFALRLRHLTGDIEIEHDAFNAQPIFDVMMGIGPGGNLRPPGVSPYPAFTDFSTFSVTSPRITQPLESLWEWYGRTTMPFYTQSFDNVFDLTNRNVVITSLGAGFPGALYAMHVE